VTEAAEAVLAEATAAYQAAFGERLVGVYALGSLAHGGFSALVSDVDLGVVVTDPLDPRDAETIEAVAEGERAKGSELHGRLSVFWGTPEMLRGERPGGRFPALDRLDLIENGRLLAGTDAAREGLVRPSARELLVAGADFAVDFLAGTRRPPDGEAAARGFGSMRRAGAGALQEIRSPPVLVARGVRRVTKLVLFPVRFLFTASTGRVGTNDAAVAHHLGDDRAPGKPLVAAAARWRMTAPADDAAVEELLHEHMVPLYLHYIDDHVARLRRVGEVALALEFEDCRRRLVD
jgi:hypothetical protein